MSNTDVVVQNPPVTISEYQQIRDNPNASFFKQNKVVLQRIKEAYEELKRKLERYLNNVGDSKLSEAYQQASKELFDKISELCAILDKYKKNSPEQKTGMRYLKDLNVYIHSLVEPLEITKPTFYVSKEARQKTQDAFSKNRPHAYNIHLEKLLILTETPKDYIAFEDASLDLEDELSTRFIEGESNKVKAALAISNDTKNKEIVLQLRAFTAADGRFISQHKELKTTVEARRRRDYLKSKFWKSAEQKQELATLTATLESQQPIDDNYIPTRVEKLKTSFWVRTWPFASREKRELARLTKLNQKLDELSKSHQTSKEETRREAISKITENVQCQSVNIKKISVFLMNPSKPNDISGELLTLYDTLEFNADALREQLRALDCREQSNVFEAVGELSISIVSYRRIVEKIFNRLYDEHASPDLIHALKMLYLIGYKKDVDNVINNKLAKLEGYIESPSTKDGPLIVKDAASYCFILGSQERFIKKIEPLVERVRVSTTPNLEDMDLLTEIVKTLSENTGYRQESIALIDKLSQFISHKIDVSMHDKEFDSVALYIDFLQGLSEIPLENNPALKAFDAFNQQVAKDIEGLDVSLWSKLTQPDKKQRAETALSWVLHTNDRRNLNVVKGFLQKFISQYTLKDTDTILKIDGFKKIINILYEKGGIHQKIIEELFSIDVDSLDITAHKQNGALWNRVLIINRILGDTQFCKKIGAQEKGLTDDLDALGKKINSQLMDLLKANDFEGLHQCQDIFSRLLTNDQGEPLTLDDLIYKDIEDKLNQISRGTSFSDKDLQYLKDKICFMLIREHASTYHEALIDKLRKLQSQWLEQVKYIGVGEQTNLEFMSQFNHLFFKTTPKIYDLNYVLLRGDEHRLLSKPLLPLLREHIDRIRNRETLIKIINEVLVPHPRFNKDELSLLTKAISITDNIQQCQKYFLQFIEKHRNEIDANALVALSNKEYLDIPGVVGYERKGLSYIYEGKGEQALISDLDPMKNMIRSCAQDIYNLLLKASNIGDFQRLLSSDYIPKAFKATDFYEADEMLKIFGKLSPNLASPQDLQDPISLEQQTVDDLIQIVHKLYLNHDDNTKGEGMVFRTQANLPVVLTGEKKKVYPQFTEALALDFINRLKKNVISHLKNPNLQSTDHFRNLMLFFARFNHDHNHVFYSGEKIPEFDSAFEIIQNEIVSIFKQYSVMNDIDNLLTRYRIINEVGFETNDEIDQSAEAVVIKYIHTLTADKDLLSALNTLWGRLHDSGVPVSNAIAHAASSKISEYIRSIKEPQLLFAMLPGLNALKLNDIANFSIIYKAAAELIKDYISRQTNLVALDEFKIELSTKWMALLEYDDIDSVLHDKGVALSVTAQEREVVQSLSLEVDELLKDRPLGFFEWIVGKSTKKPSEANVSRALEIVDDLLQIAQKKLFGDDEAPLFDMELHIDQLDIPPDFVGSVDERHRDIDLETVDEEIKLKWQYLSTETAKNITSIADSLSSDVEGLLDGKSIDIERMMMKFLFIAKFRKNLHQDNAPTYLHEVVEKAGTAFIQYFHEQSIESPDIVDNLFGEMNSEALNLMYGVLPTVTSLDSLREYSSLSPITDSLDGSMLRDDLLGLDKMAEDGEINLPKYAQVRFVQHAVIKKLVEFSNGTAVDANLLNQQLGFVLNKMDEQSALELEVKGEFEVILRTNMVDALSKQLESSHSNLQQLRTAMKMDGFKDSLIESLSTLKRNYTVKLSESYLEDKEGHEYSTLLSLQPSIQPLIDRLSDIADPISIQNVEQLFANVDPVILRDLDAINKGEAKVYIKHGSETFTLSSLIDAKHEYDTILQIHKQLSNKFGQKSFIEIIKSLPGFIVDELPEEEGNPLRSTISSLRYRYVDSFVKTVFQILKHTPLVDQTLSSKSILNTEVADKLSHLLKKVPTQEAFQQVHSVLNAGRSSAIPIAQVSKSTVMDDEFDEQTLGSVRDIVHSFSKRTVEKQSVVSPFFGHTPLGKGGTLGKVSQPPTDSCDESRTRGWGNNGE